MNGIAAAVDGLATDSVTLMQRDVGADMVDCGEHVRRPPHAELHQRQDVRVVRYAKLCHRRRAQQVLVEQHPVARRDDPATLPAHGGLAAQNGFFETDDHVLVCALVLQMLTDVAPYRLDPGHGICGITRVVEIHRHERPLRGHERAKAF